MPAQTTTTKAKKSGKGKKMDVPKKNLNRDQVAKVAKSVASKLISGAIETKRFYREYYSSPSITVTPELLTGMVTGLDDNDMVGEKCRLSSITIRYFINLGDATNFVRVILFQDRHYNDIAVTQNNILEVGSGASPIIAQYNLEQVPHRFSILHDKVINLDSDDPTYFGTIRVRKFPKKYLEFASAPTITGSIAQGHVYLMVVSDSAATPYPNFESTTYLFYKDA